MGSRRGLGGRRGLGSRAPARAPGGKNACADVSLIEVTGTALRDSWRDDSMPPVEQVRPGLWSIPVPIPRNPLRYVIVYALELADGVAVIDTGWSTDDAWTPAPPGARAAAW